MRYYKVSEVAELFGIDDGKILKEIAAGKIIAVNIAQDANGARPRWRISQKDLDAWIASRSNQLRQPAPRKRRRRAETSGRQWF